jgi:hypothetical protein
MPPISHRPAVLAVVLAVATAASLLVAGQDAKPPIPQGAVAFQGHHYLLVDEVEDLSWSLARDACADRGATLAVITTRDEAEFVAGLCDGRYMYLGATDEGEEGTWVWIDGSEWDFTYWMDGQPNDYDGHENYLATYDDGEWVDVDSEGAGFWMPTGYICEWDHGAGEEVSNTASPEIELVPGQLDVVSMTAIELDGRLPEGVEPIGYAWSIVEGEGGTLIKSEQQDAVFLAPKVERGVREFLVQLVVSYEGQPSSTRQLRIRVVPTDPAAALDGSDPDDTDWLDSFYDGKNAADRSGGGSQIVVPGTSGGGGPTVSIGVRRGRGGWHGGVGVGVRIPLSYPVTQPVDVPAPGRSSMPGEGKWDAATPVPYDELQTTFPPSIAERYEIVEDPEPSAADAETDTDTDTETETEHD